MNLGIRSKMHMLVQLGRKTRCLTRLALVVSKNRIDVGITTNRIQTFIKVFCGIGILGEEQNLA